MKSILLIFPFSLLLFGCTQHPKDGDVYEKKLTRERVEVDVDECSFLKSYRNTINRIAKRVEKDMIKKGRTNYSALKDGDYAIINAQYEDSTATCVGYLSESNRNIKTYHIVPVNEFEEDFNLIE